MIACGTVAPENGRHRTTIDANTPSIAIHNLARPRWPACGSDRVRSGPGAGVLGADSADSGRRVSGGDCRRLSGDVRPARAGVGLRTDRHPDPCPSRNSRVDPRARLHPRGHRIRSQTMAGQITPGGPIGRVEARGLAPEERADRKHRLCLRRYRPRCSRDHRARLQLGRPGVETCEWRRRLSGPRCAQRADGARTLGRHRQRQIDAGCE
jgi:hypothetical protein